MQVYHPNIDLEGNVCLNILREDWKPVLNINIIIYGLYHLFIVSWFLKIFKLRQIIYYIMWLKAFSLISEHYGYKIWFYVFVCFLIAFLENVGERGWGWHKHGKCGLASSKDYIIISKINIIFFSCEEGFVLVLYSHYLLIDRCGFIFLYGCAY